MKEFHDVLGGPRLKYRAMKNELLIWYKSQERHGSRYWKTQLMEATMKSEEPLKVYALRLQELARKAYPHSEMERVRELRHHFLETVPADFARQVQITQDAAKATGKSRKLNWTCILRLSEKEDERKKKLRRQPEPSQQNRVWFSRPETMNQHSTAYKSARAGQISGSGESGGSAMPTGFPHSNQFCGNINVDMPRNMPSVSDHAADKGVGQQGHSLHVIDRPCVVHHSLLH